MTERSNYGPIQRGENCNTETETLYSVGGRLMYVWSNDGMIETGEH